MHARPVGLAGAGLVAIQAAPALAFLPPGRLLFPAETRVADAPAVALTFDDGPEAQVDRFLVELRRANARATFFLVGEQVARFPAGARLIAEAGHEIGVHGHTHRCHLTRSPWELAEDLRRARATIEDAAGVETRLFRPPYGVFALGSWREAGWQGWRRVLWSRWGRDWEARATAESIAARIGQPRGGEILLLHDSDRYSAPNSWRRTLAALPPILERIEQAGLGTATVSELLATVPDR